MRIGIVSDTHDQLRNVASIVAIFEAARVARVVHTGDITQPKTLRAFAGLTVPLVGVYGNNDREREGLALACTETGADFVDGPRELAWAGRRVLVTHDPKELAADRLLGCDVLLHGHEHRPTLERRDGVLIVNPGECAGHLKGYNAVGVLDLDTLVFELVNF
jgi:putative phosphoesterase